MIGVNLCGASLMLPNQIETRYTKAQAQVEKITQSLLAKAFRGELVPQDPTDDPATKLLDEIRVSRKQSKLVGNLMKI